MKSLFVKYLKDGVGRNPNLLKQNWSSLRNDFQSYVFQILFCILSYLRKQCSGAANSGIWPNCALCAKSVKLGTNIL